MRPTIAVTAATLILLGASLTGCAKDEPAKAAEPAVCASASDLETSIKDLQNIDLTSSGALADLQTGFTTVKSNLADVKSDAKSEFSSQIAAIDTAYEALKTSLDAATSNPSVAALTAAGAALAALGTDVKTLATDVKSTC